MFFELAYNGFNVYIGVNPMKRFDDDRYYRTHDPALAVIATRGTLAQWRSHGKGPPFLRFGNRILYQGASLNGWLDDKIVHPGKPDDHPTPPR